MGTDKAVGEGQTDKGRSRGQDKQTADILLRKRTTQNNKAVERREEVSMLELEQHEQGRREEINLE